MLYVVTALLSLFLAIKLKTKQLRANKRFEDEIRFEKNWCYDVLAWSYAKPVSWFVDDNSKKNRKLEDLREQLALSGFNDYFNVRSYLAFKTILFFASLFCALMIVFFFEFAETLLPNMVDMSLATPQYIAIFILFLVVPLFPNMLLKGKVNQRLKDDSKDIPVFQMFVILMIRSNKTVQDILFALSKMDSPHKEVFEKGHRMFLRNQKEGITYLRNYFKDSRFSETFGILADIGEYPKNECVRILESNLNSIVEETNTIKRRADLTRLIYSQGSLAIPFASLLLLGVLPIIYWGLQSFTTAMNSL